MPTLASTRWRNHCKLRYSSRNLPLNDSSVPFCHGLPGSISAVSICAAAASGESRTRRIPGRCPIAGAAARRGRSRAASSTSITRPDRMPPATSMAKHSRVNSSIDRQALQSPPVCARVEDEVVRPDVIRRRGGNGRGRLVATRRRGRRRGTCRPAWRQRRCADPHSSHDLLRFKKIRIISIAEPRILCGQVRIVMTTGASLTADARYPRVDAPPTATRTRGGETTRGVCIRDLWVSNCQFSR